MQADFETGMKICGHCGVTKPISEYTNSYKSKDGLEYTCKECNKNKAHQYHLDNKEKRAERQRQYLKAKKEGTYMKVRGLLSIEDRKIRDLETARDWQRKKKYGVSREEFTELWNKQSGKCAVCDTNLQLNRDGYAIDHNHETGKVRGLLCNNCNRVIGLIKEDKDRFHRLAEYLVVHG